MEALNWIIRTAASILYIPIGIILELVKFVFWGAFQIVFFVLFLVAFWWGWVNLGPIFVDAFHSIPWNSVWDFLGTVMKSMTDSLHLQ